MRIKVTALLFISFLIINSIIAQVSRNTEKLSRLRVNEMQYGDTRSHEYEVSTRAGTYADLHRPVTLNVDMHWDQPDYQIPVGFLFKFFDQTYDSLYVLDFGVNFDYDFYYFIDAFYADLIHRDTPSHKSPISYKLEGEAPSRILKVEWKNAGFFKEWDSLHTTNDYISFQLWLYEGSNEIEVHIGPNEVNNNEIAYYFNNGSGPYIGLWNDNNKGRNIYLTGDPANPVPVIGQSDITLNGTPAEGTIYKFSPEDDNSIKKIRNGANNIRIYPNPVENELSIPEFNHNTEIHRIVIHDAFGRQVKNEESLNGSSLHSISIPDLATGIYILRIYTKNDLRAGRFIKK